MVGSSSAWEKEVDGLKEYSRKGGREPWVGWGSEAHFHERWARKEMVGPGEADGKTDWTEGTKPKNMALIKGKMVGGNAEVSEGYSKNAGSRNIRRAVDTLGDWIREVKLRREVEEAEDSQAAKRRKEYADELRVGAASCEADEAEIRRLGTSRALSGVGLFKVEGIVSFSVGFKSEKRHDTGRGKRKDKRSVRIEEIQEQEQGNLETPELEGKESNGEVGEEEKVGREGFGGCPESATKGP